MNPTGFADLDEAHALAETAIAAIDSIRDGAFWKLVGDEHLDFGRQLEILARKVFAAQIHHAGVIDQLGLAKERSCSSTQALLREAFTISHADAAGRVKAAAQILPRQLMTGEQALPLLPELAQAVDSGCVGPEHVKIIVETMAKIRRNAPLAGRDLCEATLVDTAMDNNPKYLENAAQRILEKTIPDEDVDDTTPASKMELHFGNRSPRTGLTPIKGQLDDHGVEVIKKAIDALSAPRPDGSRDEAGDAVQDPRPAANRRAHGLIEVLGRYLDAGLGPIQGGERPHVTITMNWDALTGLISNASFDSGAMISPSQARRLLCDAQVIPMILGSKSEVLDVGRASRTFPAHIRRAITARDKGCCWPGCDRPPDWSDGHHIDYWYRDFGATSYENGCLLCPFHHAEIHKNEWVIRMAADGTPEFIPPRWLDPSQKPRRNTLHKFDMN